ncbi:MAG: PilW family protein [Polyangiales bacterium]
MKTRSRSRAVRRHDERGFTLLELLVAAIAGLFVVLAAFLLSRGATRLFAAEGRVANTQLNLRLGIERLRSDIERASFMGSPNAYLDPDVCPKPNSIGGFGRLQGIYYEMGTAATAAVATPQSAAQGLTPDSLTLTGNFTTTDAFLAADIAPATSGGGVDITMQLNWGSTARLLAAGEGGSTLAAVQAVFVKGRFLRVRNILGASQFMIIESAGLTADGRPLVTTQAAPTYTTPASGVAGGDRRCGGAGNCIGCEVAPVQIIRYSVKSLIADPTYAWAYPTGGGVGDTTKYDLVREELDKNGSPIAGTAEIVAEYAVDLGFAFSVDTSAVAIPGAPFTEPNIVALDFGNAENATWGGDSSTLNPAVRPQRIRSVRYRLTTRTRFPEMEVGVGDGGPGSMRYQLATNQFARARTVTGEVTLVNQRAIRW